MQAPDLPAMVARDDVAIAGEIRSVTSLVITDGENRREGVIHLHDILRAKIVS